MPRFLRAMQTPSKAWTRSRLPSTTLMLTRMVSPGAKSGSGRPSVSCAICSCSSSWMTFMATSLAVRPGRLVRRPGPVIDTDMVRPEIRAPCSGRILRLAPPPGSDTLVMAGQQHVRHRTTLPLLWAGELRVFQQLVGKTLFAQRCCRTDHAWQQPHAGIDQGDRGGLTARQHDVAEAYFFERSGLDDALIDPFEA